MSSSSDPVTVILDKLNEWKWETSKVVHSSLEKISQNETVKSIGDAVMGQKSRVLKPFITSPPPAPPPAPSGLWERGVDWVWRHKVVVGLACVGITSGSFYYYYYANIHNCQARKKRRAKRASNGARKEVVILASSPAEPISRAIAADLDKRGFIVYWTTSSSEEESFVEHEGSADIRPLPIKVTDSYAMRETILKLKETLDNPVAAFPGATPHVHTLAGVLIVPDLFYPSGPVESILEATWSDLIYSKVLGPIFLLSNGLLDLVRSQQSRIILVTPSIMGSLSPGFHAAESIASNALSTLALCLHRELKPFNVPFVHLRLGSFDVNHGHSKERQIANGIRADILSWPDNLRNIYGSQYQASAHLQTARTNGSPLRQLNHAIFESLTSPHPRRVWYVGRGSYSYQFIGSFFPESLVTWLLLPSTATPLNYGSESEWEKV